MARRFTVKLFPACYYLPNMQASLGLVGSFMVTADSPPCMHTDRRYVERWPHIGSRFLSAIYSRSLCSVDGVLKPHCRPNLECTPASIQDPGVIEISLYIQIPCMVGSAMHTQSSANMGKGQCHTDRNIRRRLIWGHCGFVEHIRKPGR